MENRIVKFPIKVVIEVDMDKLKEKYPNYRINYSTYYEFIQARIYDIKQDHMQEYGYSIKVIDEDDE